MDIYLLRNDTKLGPYSEVKVRQMLQSGLISAQDMSWHPDLVDWVPLGFIMGVTPPLEANVSDRDIAVDTSKRKRFRILVGGSFLLLVIATVAVINQTLPEPLESLAQKPDSPSQDLIALADLIALVASYVGMALVKRWGRLLFLVAFGCFTFLGLFAGPDVESPLTSLLNGLFSVSCGAILAMAFLTDLFDV